MKYLKLIRWPHLLGIVIAQILIKYGFFKSFGLPYILNDFGFALLALATICLTGGGYTIAAIYNVEADEINYPQTRLIGKRIPEKQANKLFFVFNIIGVLIGFYLSNLIGHPGFSVLFIGISALYYANSAIFKKYLLVEPFVSGVLIVLSLLLVGVYDLWPAITDQTRQTAATFLSILLDYSLFVGVLETIRKIITTQIEINGDHKMQYKTLPLLVGQGRTKFIILFLIFLPVAGSGYYIYYYFFKNDHILAGLYGLLFILLPLIYTQIKLIYASDKKDFIHLNLLFKLIIGFSLLSIGTFKFML